MRNRVFEPIGSMFVVCCLKVSGVRFQVSGVRFRVSGTYLIAEVMSPVEGGQFDQKEIMNVEHRMSEFSLF